MKKKYHSSKLLRSQNKNHPWEVEGAVVDGKSMGIDYDKLISQFGTKHITEETLERFKQVTGEEPHPFLKRGVFFHKEI